MPIQPELTRNCIISPNPGHWLMVPHRLLDVEAETGAAYVFRMRPPFVRPKLVPWQQIRSDLAEELLTIEAFVPPPVLLLQEEELPDKYRDHRDKWWNVFEPILGECRYRQILAGNGKIIGRFAEQNHLPKKSVYRFVYRFFYYGCVPNAFLPRFDLRGGFKQTRLEGTRKLGRPPKPVQLGHVPTNAGVVITDEDREHFQWAMETYWAAGEHWTFGKTYDNLCLEYYSEKVGDTIKLNPMRPTLGQFKYQAKRLPQFAALQRRRIGEKKWDRNFRAIIGTSSAEVFGPTDRYQIDATIADVYLTSIYNRNWIIGRPVVYVVVDVFSGYNVGLYVGLEGPSWEGARLAILNAFTDKTEFLARYGFGPETEWRAGHIPVHMYADRAELLSENAQGLTTGLGVTIDIASSYRPDWKGLVERRFGLANETVIHFLPGAVIRRNRERGERDVALDGTLNLREFTAIMIRDLLYQNKHQRYENRCTPAMIAAGVSPTPTGLWDFGMEHLVGGTPYRSNEEIYAHLLPQGSGSVQEDGIHFQGLRYTSPYAMQNRWFERARYHKRFSVSVKYHQETPGRIWIVDRPTNGSRLEVHEATLLDPHKRYEQARWEEAMDLLAYEDLQRVDADEVSLEARLNQMYQDRNTIAGAKRERQAQQVNTSSRQRRKDIRGHRANEKAAQRKVQAVREMAGVGQQPWKNNAATANTPMLDKSRLSPMDAMIWQTLADAGEDL